LRRVILIIFGLAGVFLHPGYAREVTPPESAIDRVVVIHLDTTRVDDIGCYSGLVETPNIDALAAEGMRYTNSIAVVPKTSPSIANFFTGLYARNNGVYRVGHALSRKQRTVAEVLQENGYKTVGYTANMSISDLGFVKAKPGGQKKPKEVRKLHFGQGFDAFISFPPLTDTPRGTIEQVIAASMDYVDKNEESKFFMWMLLVEPHGPYMPPVPYDKMYADGRELIVPSRDVYVKGPDDPADPGDGDDGHEKMVTKISYVEGENNSDYYVSRHMGEVSYADFWIGKLIDRIKALPGKTLFIVTADHGESFGDVDYWFDHGSNVRYPCVNVPLIISCDGVVPVGVSDALVANIDLASTILDLLNVTDDGFSPAGRSLVPTFTVKEPWPDRMIPTISTRKWRGVRSQRYSFQCVYDEETQATRWLSLFDVEADPKEQHNLVGSKVSALREHLDFFEQWNNNPDIHRVEEIDFRDDEEMRQRLDSLGYVGN